MKKVKKDRRNERKMRKNLKLKKLLKKVRKDSERGLRMGRSSNKQELRRKEEEFLRKTQLRKADESVSEIL